MSPRVPLGASKMISEPMVRSTQTVHYVRKDQNKLPLEPRHLGVLSVASKMIYEPMVLLAQTMHLSCTDTNTISKLKEEEFHMTHVTLEFHQVHPKRSPSLWYV
jgi:hypothetical protein